MKDRKRRSVLPTQFAFRVPENEELVLRNIQFKEMGILLIDRNPKVDVHNCSVSGDVSEVFRLEVAMGVRLQISDCIFANTQGFVLFYDIEYDYQTVPATSRIVIQR